VRLVGPDIVWRRSVSGCCCWEHGPARKKIGGSSAGVVFLAGNRSLIFPPERARVRPERKGGREREREREL
jgi:hypothetical protein